MSAPAYTYWRLTRWLGPWTTDNRSPAGVARRRLLLAAQCKGDHAVEALVYTAADHPAIGSYLLVHGLNPRGPDDERCDRFARILAHAGFVVMCPRMDALTQMRLGVSAIDQLARSLEALVALEEHPSHKLPGVFSISFGSFPALMTAASPRTSHLVGSLVVFGGYANFADTCRFMSGAVSPRNGEPQPDPTCMVGLAVNMARDLCPGEDGRKLAHAWLAFLSRVWGVPEMTQPERFSEVARQLAADLPADLAQTFLQGCGVVPGFASLVEEALARIDVEAMDPRRHLHAIRCPVHLFHGRRDDVIPFSQMAELAAGLSGAHTKSYLTGLYDHSRGRSAVMAFARLPALFREIKTMAAMMHALVLGGTRVRPVGGHAPSSIQPKEITSQHEAPASLS
jgi:pimeloyl-ACP methyl ester carboxylesterase